MTVSTLPADAAPRGGAAERRAGASSIRRVLSNPGRAISAATALLRGAWYRAYYRLRGVRFRAGRNFRAYSALQIRGPGLVTFGDNVLVVDPARLWTHSPEARITLGDNTMMGAADIQCQREVSIGSGCILARCTIMDSDFHSTHAGRHNPAAPVRVAPVHVGDNVWIAHSAGLLPGTKIGNNSVVSFGSVCMREYPENVVLMGNPARVAAPVAGAGAPPNAANAAAEATRAGALRVAG